MKKLDTKTKGYQEIYDVLYKHKDLFKSDPYIDILPRVRNRIKLQGLSKAFGIDVPPDSNPEWINLNEYISIGLFGEKHNRTISCSDDDRQPEDEHLLRISFPTGPYIFHRNEYCEQTFKVFFDELKSYGPKYSDTNNKALYFSSDTAQAVYNAFNGILKKHQAKVVDELKQKEIAALKKKLEKLEGGE